MLGYLCPNSQGWLSLVWPTYRSGSHPWTRETIFDEYGQDYDVRLLIPDEKYREVVIQRAYAKGVLAPDCPVYRCDSADLPDHYFFNCWEWDAVNECVTIPWDKALARHREWIKEACEREIKTLMPDLLIAVALGPEGERVRQAERVRLLRGLSESHDLSRCKTLEDIKAAWPSEVPDLLIRYGEG